MRQLPLMFVLTLVLGGCAGTKIHMPDATDSVTQQLAFNRTHRQALPSPRKTPTHLRRSVIVAVDYKIRPAAIRVCERTFRNPQDCARIIKRRTLAVVEDSNDFNASIGAKYNITLLGGVAYWSGSDAEIAAVLSHEYAHGMMGHVLKGAKNTLGGMLIGAAIGGLIGTATGDPTVFTNLGQSGINIGGQMGQLAYSKDMELEADHLGLFILHDAGFDIQAASRVFIRMSGAQRRLSATGSKQVFGIFNTHPSHQRRIEQLIATEQVINRGATRPTWAKDAALDKKRQEDEALYRKHKDEAIERLLKELEEEQAPKRK